MNATNTLEYNLVITSEGEYLVQETVIDGNGDDLRAKVWYLDGSEAWPSSECEILTGLYKCDANFGDGFTEALAKARDYLVPKLGLRKAARVFRDGGCDVRHTLDWCREAL